MYGPICEVLRASAGSPLTAPWCGSEAQVQWEAELQKELEHQRSEARG